MPPLPTLASLTHDLERGRTTALALVESCLAAIHDVDGEGGYTFVDVDAAGALKTASAFDAMREAGSAPSPFAGIPIAVKDLFDVQGQVTRAGSTVLAGNQPAQRDAECIGRLRRMGFVIIGRTNMTEFAYSGLGLNPHYGTPRSRWRPHESRVPGGSSSGSAIAVAMGMAHAGIGTDTGGSCRIPAAFNSLVGFKPTARRVPLDGIVPLSSSLDSVGSIARSVHCCATLDTILAGETTRPLEARPLHGLRLAVPRNIALDDIESCVAEEFDRALHRLSRNGALIERVVVPELDEVAELNAKGGLAAAESFAWHRHLLEERATEYDPRVLARIRCGADQSAADYIELHGKRRSLITRATARIAPYDAVLMPTTPILPPPIEGLTEDADFQRVNLLALRNPTFINIIDGCALSLPINRDNKAPVGLMIAGPANTDRDILSIALAIEALGRDWDRSPIAADEV